MTGIISSFEDDFKFRIEKFPWINWSKIARIEMNKRRMSEEFKITRKISKEDKIFCESIDWHPVDELPLKKEFIKELKERKKGPFVKLKSIEELFKE
jgi:hypothetical protein